MTDYGTAIRFGFEYLLKEHREVFTIGQGLWSPWYVGNSMTDLDIKFGKERVIDTPVSELACTGAALGAALSGYRPVVIHPRMDFMLLAVDQIVTQAANWYAMFGGQVQVPLTVRAIVNRGGEQGAQHSQSLHSWFAHVPGLRVVMPATPRDARDLLIGSVLSNDPVLYVDDRWLYELEEDIGEAGEVVLDQQGPARRREGSDLTLVGAGYSAQLCMLAADELATRGVECDVIDLRVISPLKTELIEQSVASTGLLLAVDGGYKTCGLAGEVIASVAEALAPESFRASPARITLPEAPAPTSAALEKAYYPQVGNIVERAMALIERAQVSGAGV
jgi:acetoin:2,6-dichlorophenolindophenol oxidoreductase subunit beta